MPQLTKGGKWVFGWCVVGLDGEIQIPPEAYIEYGFQPDETVVITLGSRHSGGYWAFCSAGRFMKEPSNTLKL
jgi:hypothetical protein